MEFLAVITVLVAMQVWGNGGVVQRDTWLDELYLRLKGIANPRLRLAALIVLPVLLVLVVQGILAGVIWGIPLLLFYIAVLLYSLGRGDFSMQLNLYYEAWDRGDLVAAYELAQQLEEFDSSVALGNARDLHDNVRAAIFYQGFERWFAVVFWFVILGPAAALAYRLFKMISQKPETSEDEQSILDNAVYFVEWLPVRLLSFTFALAGNFERCIGACREQMLEQRSAVSLLDSCGRLAISDPIPEHGDEDGFPEQASKELHSSQQLLYRSVLCWVTVLAAIQLI
jgi:AmpE protein